MVWNIKLKCKCGSVLISSPPWPNNNTSETGSAYSICGVSPQRLTESRGPRGTEPKQDVDDDTWFPLMNETQVDTKSVQREIVWDRTVWTSSRSAPHYCAISNFLRRDVWTATCELVVKADKQTQLKVRSLRISLFILHKYLSDCMCPCAVFFYIYFHMFIHTQREEDKVTFCGRMIFSQLQSNVLLLLGKLPRQHDWIWSMWQAYITANLCLSCGNAMC